MRFLCALFLLTATLSGGPAQAIEYPWCARYGESHGGINCGFVTWEQCLAAISGNGGHCERNGAYAAPAPRHPQRKLRTGRPG